MSNEYWIAEGVVIEFFPNGSCNLVIPSLRHRFAVGLGVVPVLCEIAHVNSQGRGAALCDLSDKSGMASLIAQLRAFGIIVENPEGRTPEDTGDMMSLLERATLRVAQMGGCYRPELPQNVQAPPRFAAVASADNCIPLPKPHVPADMNLWNTMMRRRSRRDGPERHITLEQLSGIMHYSLHIQQEAVDKFGEISFRPVASGGARHPIDVFISPLRVSGLAQGVYQYDPELHRLILVGSAANTAEALASFAVRAMGQAPNIAPALTFVFAAVPARTACKYADSALLTALRDMGCVLQQIYLVVEGLGLAGCAIGGSDHGFIDTVLPLRETGHCYVGAYVLW